MRAWWMLSVLWLAACSAPAEMPAEPSPSAAVLSGGQTDAAGGPYTAAEATRGRATLLDRTLRAILQVLRPRVAEVMAGLERDVNGLTVPERLATQEPGLRGFGAEQRGIYQARVDELYAQASERLSRYHDVALATATARALELSLPRAPLDEGVTGDMLQNRMLTSFQETLTDLVALNDLPDLHERDRVRSMDYLQVFSSGPAEGADQTLGGRLLLFVGGSEAERPACLLFYRGAGTADRALVQVVRHRIQRGMAVEYDIPWRLDPRLGAGGQLVHETLGEFLVARDVGPRLRREAPSFERLRDRRTVVDLQSVLLDPSAGVVGGVDWRIEFVVTMRGDVSWQLGPRPRFDPYCTEAKRLLAR